MFFNTISEPLINGIPQSLGNSDQSSFGYGKRDIWYSIKDGNWNDPNVWHTTSGRRLNDYPGSGGLFPTDDVVIRHAVRINFTSIAVNNLVIAPNASWVFNSALSVTINGNLQCYGTWDMNSFANNVTLLGYSNFCNSFINPTNSTVTYSRIGDQSIMNIGYYNLAIGISSTRCVRSLTSNISITNNLTLNNGASASPVTFELGGYDVTVGGTTSIGNNSVLSKFGGGNVLFTGNLTNNGGTGSVLDFSAGNPTVELRGGITALGGVAFTTFSTGTGQWKFSTNNQSISAGALAFSFDAPILISGAITVTTVPVGGTLTVYLNNTLDGDNAASKWLNGSGSSFDVWTLLNTTTTPMTTAGIFDVTTNTKSVVGYIFNGNMTIPLTTFNGLFVGGTGTKTLSGNTTVAYTLFASKGTLECSTFNLAVTGATTIGLVSSGITPALLGNSIGTLSKSGSGTILFVGLLTFADTGSFGCAFNQAGNPSTEFRAGVSFGAWLPVVTGGGTWSLTTNSQSISATAAITIPNNILVSGAITVTIPVANTFTILTGTLDGDNVSSTFDNRGSFNYQNTTAPMLTGVLKCNAAVNTFLYSKAGAQDVQGGTTHLTTAQYWHLTLSVSGVKTLQGNVSVLNTYTLSGTATKNNNGFTFGNP